MHLQQNYVLHGQVCCSTKTPLTVRPLLWLGSPPARREPHPTPSDTREERGQASSKAPHPSLPPLAHGIWPASTLHRYEAWSKGERNWGRMRGCSGRGLRCGEDEEREEAAAGYRFKWVGGPWPSKRTIYILSFQRLQSWDNHVT
jgi:hypothetical protein